MMSNSHGLNQTASVIDDRSAGFGISDLGKSQVFELNADAEISTADHRPRRVSPLLSSPRPLLQRS